MITGRVLLLLVAVLMMGCATNDGDEGMVVSPETDDCYLDIYVYAPDHPIVTRLGEIDPISDAESEVHSLKIWVFTHNEGTLVGYLGTDADGEEAIPNPTFLNQTKQQTYKMKIDAQFANNPQNVDVYVVANEASVDINTLGKNTTRDELDEAMIGTNYFGTSSPLVSSVPSGGLPMSAIATNQPIYGSYPTLGIGKSEYEMTTLQLTRAVSKLRFVLCQIETNNNAYKELRQIDNISLDKDLIPTTSWLIPREAVNYATTNAHAAISYGRIKKDDIPKAADPMVYTYETQEAQDYEDLINHACGKKVEGIYRLTAEDIDWLNAYGRRIGSTYLESLTTNDPPQLKELGLTYLRESDKQLTGTIRYTYGPEESPTTETVSFSMAAPGDFLRNHSWIVYIYYMDSKIYTLTVTHIGMKAWVSDNTPEDTKFYNW